MTGQGEHLGVVLDLGTQNTKAGFAGEAFPRYVIPTKVGRFRNSGLLDGLPDFVFGEEAVKMRGVTNLCSPIQNGLVNNWDDMEKLLHHIFYKELHVAPEMAKIMFVIHPLTSKNDKEKITEILFESFMVQGMYLGISPAQVLFASGRTSGVVWENGCSCTYAAPVFEGFSLKNSIVTSEITGDVLTNRLFDLMSNIGYCFTTPAERLILEDIKSKQCYVAKDYENEIEIFVATEENKVQYNLPDGQHIFLGEERFKCPEILFQPQLSGLKCPSVVDDISSSIKKCDFDYKSLFYNNIVLSGGSSLLNGLTDRLTIELSRQVKSLDVTCKIDAMQSRDLAAWIGGSITASFTSLNGFWMTKDEYNDSGSETTFQKPLNFEMSLEKPTVIIDNGSFDIKAGFSCDNHPISMFRNVVGRPSYLNGSYGREHYDVFIGDDAVDKAGALDLCYPVKGGRIDNWDNMERIWHHIFYRELKAAPDDRAVMLELDTLTPLSEKIKCCEIFFETLNCPSLCIRPQSVLALYGYGVTTGICVDIGCDNASITPVYQGGPITYAQMQTNLGGNQVSEYLKKELYERGLYAGSQNDETIEIIKRKCLYITPDAAISIKDCCKKFCLPDGNEVNVSQEVFMAAEMIFQPDLIACDKCNYIPLHKSVVMSALKCDAELRPELYEAVLLCGGSSMIPGVGPRLNTEIENLTECPVSVSTSPEGYSVPWLGGAIFASLPEAKQLWVSKKRYEDYGEKIVKNKFS
ncbi:uncharacterized protein [Battus philenor]|uniref:uncharacterized protein n=1 Tax=Battus philenor TaxID=42288 RepID=UPI0035CFC307